MAALTSARSTWTRAINAITLQLPTGYTAWEGGAAYGDTGHPGLVYPGAPSIATQFPVGRFAQSVANTSGSNMGVQVIPDIEIIVRNYDSVTGSGAVTISNQLQDVYVASDHEVSTSGSAYAGRVWDVNGDGVWVQAPWSGQSAS
jgi:hypothetical protein